jgi:hypothetical protein
MAFQSKEHPIRKYKRKPTGTKVSGEVVKGVSGKSLLLMEKLEILSAFNCA